MDEINWIKSTFSKAKKSVIRYSLDRSSSQKFESVVKASESVNGSPQDVSRCCLHQRPTYMGYIWEYEDQHNYKIYQYTKSNELVCIYDTVAQASKETGIKEQNIGACYLGKQKTAGGFKWIKK